MSKSSIIYCSRKRMITLMLIYSVQCLFSSANGQSYPSIQFVGRTCTRAFDGQPCGECIGDCDNDAECAGDLRCAQRNRSGMQDVPGCSWNGSDRKSKGTDFCFMPTEEIGIINYVGECGTENYLCGLCEGDCDSDSDCEGDLVCKKRSGSEAVIGCSGEGGSRDVYGKDVCVNPQNPITPSPTPTGDGDPNINYVGECEGGILCGLCEGDCDRDSDCEGNLVCAQRVGFEAVFGCSGEGGSTDSQRKDVCFSPNTPSPTPTDGDPNINYVGECGTENYLCGLCQGDCDNDSDCEGDLVCAQRSGFEAVIGCSGEGGSTDLYAKDVCVGPGSPPIVEDSLSIDELGCSESNPCPKCTGGCDVDSDCIVGLECFQRSGSEPIPNCVTGGSGDVSDTNYCYERPPLGDVTYVPGDISKVSAGLSLSTGLEARVIATSGRTMPGFGYTFHSRPDGGAVFPVTEGSNAGGWVYVSNSEVNSGGVGAITFNSSGEVIDYEMIMTDTSTNCGGGKTYWGTWVSCEEWSGGQVHEVDPHVGTPSQRQTVIGGTGGKYESFAYDARDKMNPAFYVTHDSSSGGLIRFTPDPSVVSEAEATGDYSKMLTTIGTLHWLVLSPSDGTRYSTSGTFEWDTSRARADDNASRFYPSSEGIDIRNGMVYFTTKAYKDLFILDLDAMTYTRSGTQSGAFDGQPDQIQRILSDEDGSDMLYFCEEASSDNGVHARDTDGNFYTIINGGVDVNSETTGLAFSPDNKHMYVSYQGDGLIFDITREDGYPFGAHRLDIKYHNS